MILALKLCAVGFIGTILAMLVKEYNKELLPCIVVTAGIIILYFVLDGIVFSLDYFKEFYNKLSYGKEFLPIILKITAITYVCEFSSAICEDAGEKAIGNNIELGGKIIIFIIAIPVFKELITLISNLL